MMSTSYRQKYPEGTRIELIMMGDDPHPIEAGTRASVQYVDDIGTVHCKFDNGRSLGLIPGEDSFRKLTSEEIEEERRESQQSQNENNCGPKLAL
mgnify:CR=1 FL=1